MTQPDFRGARGANAGDDFHELWALRHALGLIDEDSKLKAITVEGLNALDETGQPLDTWDGVDCTFYFGSDHVALAERIEIDQLKYSSANPDKPWTVSRLTHTTNKKQNNSVIFRLATAFKGLTNERPALVDSGQLRVRLVSNQPVDPAVIDALCDGDVSELSSKRKLANQTDRAKLERASGLGKEHFAMFVKALDLTECGAESRFALEARLLRTVSEWTDDDARTTINDLMRHVRRLMMPEAKGAIITRQSVVAWLGFSDPRALFPCPPVLNRVERIIPREATSTLAKELVKGVERICLHGEGGCGKTTVLQELEGLLPTHSVVVVFDCYGGGHYLDSNAYRHRGRDAFLQLSNDLAGRLRIPLLVSSSPDLDYPRVFMKRLERAADVVSSQSRDALLVVVIDAADNSVMAAKNQSPPERSFIHDFLALGALPNNVRFVVTTRPGRLETLGLPGSVVKLELRGFTSDETVAHAQGFWPEAPDTWIEDFHHLSRENPRVQRYALDYAGEEPARAIDYLRPNGKGLDEVFKQQLNQAATKAGTQHDISTFCSGLVALPRPIPLHHLSEVTELSKAHILDLCSDLAPGIRVSGDRIGFADEDFEHFIRAEAEEQLAPIQQRIADHFSRRHRQDEYAAFHLAGALLNAGRGREIVQLINDEREPEAIRDPVLQREAQLQRLRIAMKVCREAGDDVAATMTLVIGAEAVKTDAVIRRMLVENPDLAAQFARDTASRVVLRDAKQLENHGPLLFHLLVADAQEGNGIAVREGHRQLQAWLQRRTENFEEQKRKHPGFGPRGWPIDLRDIVAETEAVLRIAGPQPAVDHLLRWRPKLIALGVASILIRKLIMSGETSLVERGLAETSIQSPWDLFILTPLAQAGRAVDLSRLEAALLELEPMLGRGLFQLNSLTNSWQDDPEAFNYLDTILTACEIVVARGGNHACVIPILERFADQSYRRRDHLFLSQVVLIDFSLRSHALLERMSGGRATLESYCVSPPTPTAELSQKELRQRERSDREKREELQEFLAPLVDIYDLRAHAFLGAPANEVNTSLQAAISRYHNLWYRIDREYRARPLRMRCALSLTRLLAVPTLSRTSVYELVDSLLRSNPASFDASEMGVFLSLAVDMSLHLQILKMATSRAREIRSAKISADEKLGALVLLARLLMPFTIADAGCLFNQAVEVAGELDEAAIHQIALLEPFAERGGGSLAYEDRRALASDLATFVCDAGVRLNGNDHFPWAATARTLTKLDTCIALAAAARWEDSNVIDRATFLPPVLETALAVHTLSASHATALSVLLDDLNLDLVGGIVEAANGRPESSRAVAEGLAREELLRLGQGRRSTVADKLRSLFPGYPSGSAMDHLVRATEFHSADTSAQPSTRSTSETAYSQADAKRLQILSSVSWGAYRFVAGNEIDHVLGHIEAEARASQALISKEDILARMRQSVTLGNRAAHVAALVDSERLRTGHELASAIAKGVDEWSDTPSVQQWCRKSLLHIIIRFMPEFSRWLAFEQSPLPDLLEKSGASHQQISSALLQGMELHVDTLDAATTYALIGLIGRYSSPAVAGEVMKRYVQRLVQQVPAGDREAWDLAEVPNETARAIARYLFALMGDVDLRIRWRAAHALRRLVRLGDHEVLNEIVGLYSRTFESTFRQPGAPFYWMAARLWLVITLDRIAEELPVVMGQHGRHLFEVATDNEFPHVLVRAFAKAAALKLVRSGCLSLTRPEQEALSRVNTSPIPRKKKRHLKRGDFDPYSYEELRKRRFHFDSMDTLPYWYSGALRAFADVRAEEFLDIAERWIVGNWDGQGAIWQWDSQPRRHRFSDYSLSTSHRHGSLPTLERFTTYLEWHAMLCTTGELMQHRALQKADDDDYHSFEQWLGRAGLSAPPLWLADLVGPKPLEPQFWLDPDDLDRWVENVESDDFLSELGLLDSKEGIVVDGHHETRSRNFASTVSVSSALVSSDTATALVRALQSVDDPWDYKLPSPGEDHEIDVPPYKLVGWLVDNSPNSGLDERDPLRFGISGIQCSPTDNILAALDSSFVHDDQARWVSSRQNTALFYEAWGDECEDDRRGRGPDSTIHSTGRRLRVDREALLAILKKIGLDLVVEVQITRRGKGYEYSRYDEEEAKEARFDRVLLLRSTGTIEAAEGRLGTWTTSGA